MELTGKMLIAMPGMADPRFEHSVVLLCSHDDEAAMGLIVNKPSEDVTMAALMRQLDLTPDPAQQHVPVYFGGPVEGARGFVLHTPDYASNLQTLTVNDTFAMTATLDILEDIAEGRGPDRALMVLGYAGWGPGQLEAEIGMNGWLTADADAALVFDTPDAEKWGAALSRLGVDPLTLSASAGHA